MTRTSFGAADDVPRGFGPAALFTGAAYTRFGVLGAAELAPTPVASVSFAADVIGADFSIAPASLCRAVGR